jgi:hypothetical protein
MPSAAANTRIPVFLVIFQILHQSGTEVPFFNGLNGWRFTKPAVGRADVIEDECSVILASRGATPQRASPTEPKTSRVAAGDPPAVSYRLAPLTFPPRKRSINSTVG